MNVALVEYGAGNLPSVERALKRLGVESCRASTAEAMTSCDALILPGVGHFGALMRSLKERSLVEPLRRAVREDVPLLGICLGLQAMFASSDEAPGDAGLAFFPQKVSALPQTDRLPHMGWNQLRRVKSSTLLQGVAEDAYFYFAHSYAALDAGEASVALCDHGTPFVAVLEQGNLFATQFHPEKSGAVGAHLLSNFVRQASGKR
jgi:imidazole glycerol phosphate synthase glutamine amidotransferase subunit